MPSYRLSRRARDDLAGIGRYTRQRWGSEQRNRYLQQLVKRFEVLARNPSIGAVRTDIGPGYRDFRAGRHLIIYREAGDRIDIVRLLHERMDANRHF